MLRQLKAVDVKRWFRHWRCGLLLAILALQWAWVQQGIARTGSYPGHVDQRYLVGPAKRILQKGELNPRFFNYPSAPIYLTVAGMSFGLLQEQKNDTRNRALRVKDLGSVDSPFIKYPKVVNTARQVFGALSILGIALIGVLGSRLYGANFLWAAPLVLVTSALYYDQSATYVNVDILTAVGVALTLLTLVTFRHSLKCSERVLLPALCAGVTIACKYTMAVVLVPLIASVWLFGGPRPIRRSLAALATAVLAFLALTPFALLDLPRFLDDVGFEVFHYAVGGHADREASEGWEQLVFYSGVLAKQFTWPGLGLVLLGMGLGLRRAPRSSVICLLFVIVLLWLLCGQIVHFGRNVVALVGPLAIWFVLGAQGLVAGLWWMLERWSWYRGWPARVQSGARWALAVGLACAWFVSGPAQVLAARTTEAPDSRVEFQYWAAQELKQQTVHIPKELAFDARPLTGVEVRRYSLKAKGKKDVKGVASRHGEYALVPQWRDKRYKKQLGRICGKVIRQFEGRSVKGPLAVDPLLRVKRIEPCSKAR